MNRLSTTLCAAVASLFLSSAPTASGQTEAPQSGAPSADDLAKQLANPVSDLISVPFQFNYDEGAGPRNDGERLTLNIQPVIPLSLNDDWNLIWRTILPIIHQNDDVSALSNDYETGLGDTVMSFFFSPKEPSNGITWGIGPVLYLPTATEDVLGADQWGLGPTAVVLKVDGKWTYGILANHIWSLGETEDYDSFFIDRPQVNATFLQPFVTYGIGDGWSVGANLEATYDWEADQWTVPVFLNASKVTNIGGQMVSIMAGPRYYLEAPDQGPEWGFRLMITLLFPK